MLPDKVKCLNKHSCVLTRRPVLNQSYKDKTEFKCKKCKQKGKFKDLAYHCDECKYDVHAKCINRDETKILKKYKGKIESLNKGD